jgi:hypothetical protein
VSTAEDFAAVERAVRGSGEWQTALAALARIKAKHQTHVDAAGRVTDLANAQRVRENDYNKSREEAAREDRPCYAFLAFLQARELRDALGDAYMGGPLK